MIILQYMINRALASVWGRDSKSTITFGVYSSADRRAVSQDVGLLVLYELSGS